MKFIVLSFIYLTCLFADEYAYSLQDYNSTSPTYGLDVWNPQYSGFITMHFFSSQG